LFNVLKTWFGAPLEAARFSADVRHVMALRIMRLALGGPLAATEARQMVAEKVSAFAETQMAIATAFATGRGLDASADAYAPYRRRLHANCLRLSS